MASLLMPATTVILKKFSPTLYLNSIKKYQISKLPVAPPLLSFLTTSSLVDNYDISSVKECICAGSFLGSETLLGMKQKFPKLEVRQTYGITEIGSYGVIHVPHSKEGNVGVPAPTFQVKVRNPETHELLRPFQHGEICFKGPMLMKGYIGNGTIKNVLDSEGFFCSGDLGYYDEERNFFLVGRLKETMKYKGFQVSLMELELLILSHPKVKDCAVIGVPDERCGELSVAFVVPKSGKCATEEEIVQFVAGRISVSKQLHGGVRFINEIPRNFLGKILRKNLKEML